MEHGGGEKYSQNTWGKINNHSWENRYFGCWYKKKNYILGECKFRNSEFNYSQYDSLTKKINLTGNIYYYLFSLSGFSESLVELANNSTTIKLITLNDIFS